MIIIIIINTQVTVVVECFAISFCLCVFVAIIIAVLRQIDVLKYYEMVVYIQTLNSFQLCEFAFVLNNAATHIRNASSTLPHTGICVLTNKLKCHQGIQQMEQNLLSRRLRCYCKRIVPIFHTPIIQHKRLQTRENHYFISEYDKLHGNVHTDCV